jgi:hypothetical protein
MTHGVSPVSQEVHCRWSGWCARKPARSIPTAESRIRGSRTDRYPNLRIRLRLPAIPTPKVVNNRLVARCHEACLHAESLPLTHLHTHLHTHHTTQPHIHSYLPSSKVSFVHCVAKCFLNSRTRWGLSLTWTMPSGDGICTNCIFRRSECFAVNYSEGTPTHQSIGTFTARLLLYGFVD